MCYVWQNPTIKNEEISLETLSKIPSGICHLNLTGGEPTLRHDLADIVDLLYPKAATLEISSNGQYSERLEPIIRKYPSIKVRFSLEGCEETNNRIRGEKDGYRKKIEGLFRLKKLGAKDIGIATVIQDDNAGEVVDLFRFAKRNGFEFATSVLHNGFQFHKSDNFFYDRLKVAEHIEELVAEMLKGFGVKNWFRAYLNLGLISKVMGQDRILKCTAGKDFVFIDPWSDLYACNVRPDLKIGNLEHQEWYEILQGTIAKEVKKKVSVCPQNCWMVGSAKTVIRHPRYPKLPSLTPLKWVIYNKLRMMFLGNIKFKSYLDYNKIHKDEEIARRIFFLKGQEHVKKTLQSKTDEHYRKFGEFSNK